MNNFLKLNFSHTFFLKGVDSKTFYTHFESFIFGGGTTSLYDVFEQFRLGKEPFRGKFDTSGFKLKSKKKFIDAQTKTSIVKGQLYDTPNGLEINCDFVGYSLPVKITQAISLILFIIFYFALFAGEAELIGNMTYNFLFLFNGLIVLFASLLISRWDVKRLFKEFSKAIQVVENHITKNKP